jgi:hypothetical protein
MVLLPGLPGEQRSRERVVVRLREQVAPDVFDAAWRAGRALTLDEAADLAAQVAEAV